MWSRSLPFVVFLLLTGCAMPYTRTVLPLASMESDTTLGYRTEQARHDIRLYVLDQGPYTGVSMVEHWTARALPFGTLRHSKWRNGPYAFTSDVWFPSGLPTIKGDTCGWQSYEGIKLEGGKLKEFQVNKWEYLPLEFFPAEQHAFRLKCDLDVVPAYDGSNQAGY